MDTTGVVGAENALTIGADGLPVIASDAGGLRVTHCGTLDCSSGNTSTFILDSRGLPFRTLFPPSPSGRVASR